MVIIRLKVLLVDIVNNLYSGGYCGGVPPLPIPNREVKPACADGTAMQCGRVGGRHFFFKEALSSTMMRGLSSFSLISSKCYFVLYIIIVNTSDTAIIRPTMIIIGIALS